MAAQDTTTSDGFIDVLTDFDVPQDPPSSHPKEHSQMLGQYALSRQGFIEVIHRLRKCGSDTEVELPQIAVIGNQSAGKSTLIEAISGIQVPRAAGTCTRCPMEITLISSDSAEWKCKVSLRYLDSEYRAQTIDFAETATKAEVPFILRRAQLAALNPSERDLSKFADLCDGQCEEYKSELSFSNNTIVVDIKGANVDVTFVDLPGIISNTERPEDEYLIKDIEKLVASYAAKKQCLILVVISMKDDIDNQSAPKIARLHDPTGLRTIGVLTKADTVSKPERDRWLKIFRNECHALRQGYYMIRLPPTAEPGTETAEAQTVEEARKQEIKHFKPKFWQFSETDKLRVGVDQLTTALSNALAKMIEERLPDVLLELRLKNKEVQAGLESLPESFEDKPHVKLLSHCHGYLAEVNRYMCGDATREEFFQDLRLKFEKLAKRINETKPNFEIPRNGIHIPAKPILSESVTKIEDKSAHQVITLDSVRETIQKISVLDLPGVVPRKVHERFINKYVSSWLKICLELFGEVEVLLRDLVHDLCGKYFLRFRTSGLLNDAKKVSNNALEKTAERAREQIKLYCKMEANRPFTLNEDFYSGSRAKYEAEITSTQTKPSNPPISSVTRTVRHTNGISQSVSANNLAISDEELLRGLRDRGYPVNDTKQLSFLQEYTEFKTEVEVVSHVLAYFELSSKRILDVMPMIFETVFAKAFGEELENVFTTNLRILDADGANVCKKYAKDEPEVQSRRKELDSRKKTLSEALDIVSRYFK